jgi:hypothetical protein
MDHAHCSGMIALRHAVENASNEPITNGGIIAILRGAEGTGSHLRAIFGDASLQALTSAGASQGVALRTILAAYAAAKATAAAANPELDVALNKGW